MLIVFATSGLRFNGDSLKQGSLGGSETALIYMARALAKRGHEVRVFCECDRPGLYDGVHYFGKDSFLSQCAMSSVDVLVASRWYNFLMHQFPVGLRVLWMHDILVNHQEFMASQFQTDLMMPLSEFHVENYCEKLPDLRPLMWKTSNGVDMELVQKCRKPKIPGKLIYTSRPERGLHFLLKDILPKILERRPDVKLYFANYDTSSVGIPDYVKQILGMCDQIAKANPNHIIPMGHLPKESLYHQISSSQLHLYPTAFPEISCAAEGTLVQMPCNRAKYPHGVPIETLVDKSNFPVYAYDKEKHEFVLETCEKVWQTGENRECVDIQLDDGSILTVTPEHLVMTFDGDWVRADSVVAGDRLNALHLRYNTAIKQTTGRWTDEHRMVAEWEVGRELEKGEHVNHLDLTRLDNSPGMLEVLPASEHARRTFSGRKSSKQSIKKQVAGFSEYMKRTEGTLAEAKRILNASKASSKFWDNFRTWPKEKQEAWLSKRRTRIAEGRSEAAAARENHSVLSVCKSTKLHKVYDMTVRRVHNFVANGIVIHNCITAMEAQACGTPIVTTNGFALKETVGSDSGVLIDGTPEHASYIEEFAKQVCDLLDNQDRLQAMSEAGPKFIQQAGYVWDTVAERWETKFLEEMDSRWQKNTQRVIQQMEHNNDLATAEYVARKEGLLDVANRLSQTISKCSGVVPYNGNVESDFAAAMPLFQRLNALLEHKAIRPQRIFDYSANDVCYGLMLAKMFPTSEVVVRAVDEATAERLKQYAATSKLANVKVIGPADTVLMAGEKEFDLLFVGDVIDDTRDPIDLLTTAQNRYLSSKGYVLVSTRYGSRSVTKFGDGDRLWNFEFGDIRSMLADSGSSFDAVFSDEAISDRGELVGHWCWLFNKTSKLSSPSSVDKLRRTRPYESLAVCMIAKNEGDWLSGCLKTVKSIADKIVIVDTGSTDSTIQIATEFGAEVRHIKFDNFSQARNESIRDVQEDWILWVDADERIAAPDRLRRYLSTKLFEGYGIRQNHLMLDIGKTFDVPVRLLRNRPHHKFTGLIHEHCERVDRKPFDDAISPVLVLNEVDIVHYGYMNERVRRQKCSNRNMKLLIRDVQESAPNGRMLTWVLVIRDYLNFVKWSLETTKGAIAPNSRQHMLLCAVIATYRAKFGDGKHRYDPIARPMYQEALQFLGKSGLTYGDRKHPPFEIGLSLAGAFGGLEDRNVAMQSLWFLDHKEFVLHLQSKGVELAHALGASSDSIKPVEFKIESEDVVPDPVKILSTGLNIIPTRVA